MDNLQIIKEAFSKNNIPITETQLNQLNQYYLLLIEQNKVINLTAITDIEEVAIKHFVDCSLFLTEIKHNSRICDIGTGAGFPGVVLKILRPDLNIVLVDSLQKRIDFLNLVINKLNLTKIQAIHSRAQELTNFGIKKESFDYAVSRAVAKLNILNEYTLPFVKIGGKLLAFKSIKTEEEIVLASNSLLKLGGKYEKTIKKQLFSLKNEVFQRNLVIITKINTTPDLYPRQKNKIEKTPL